MTAIPIKYSAQKRVPKKRMSLSPMPFIGIIFLSFLINIIFNSIDWYRRGSTKMLVGINQQYDSQINAMKARSINNAAMMVAIDNYIINKITALANWTSSRIFKLSAYLLNKTNRQKLEEITITRTHGLITLSAMLIKTFGVLIAKLLNIIMSFWLIVFACVLGVLDGLVSRYVRTAEGGRESTFVFHQVADSLIRLPLIILLIYISAPINLSPVLVISLLLLSLFSYCHLVSSRMKKYL